MAFARQAGLQKITISDFFGSRDVVENAAEAGQEEVATIFESARTPLGALGANDPAYTEGKIRRGEDPRRGHKTGDLQTAMYAIQCWRVAGYGGGRWAIYYSDAPLIAELGYVEFFAALKAPSGILMAVTTRIVMAIMGVVKSADKKKIRREALAAEKGPEVSRKDVAIRAERVRDVNERGAARRFGTRVRLG